MSRTHRAPIVPRRADRSSAPLSFAQEGFWFLEQWRPGTSRHNMAMAMRIDGPLRVDALSRAFGLSVARHDILRSIVVERRGQPVQCVGPAPRVAMAIADIPAARTADSELTRRLIARVARRPFQLDRGPLLRVVLWRLHAEAHLLTTAMHHIVGDAWSLGVLMGEVTHTYERLIAGRPPALPPLRIQYGDYAAWERTALPEPALERLLESWARTLDALPLLDLPTDRPAPAPAARRFEGGSLPWELGAGPRDALRRLADGRRATLFMVVLAAFAVLLRRYAHQEDVTIGSPLATRPAPETEPLVGLFINTIAFRLRARGSQPFHDFLAHVREVVLDALSRGQAPFDRVVERLRQAGRPRELPVFTVMIAARPAPRRALSLPALHMRRLFVQEESAQYDMTLYTGDEPDGVAGTLNYSRELFETETVQRFLGHFDCLLHAIADKPETPLQDLPLLSQAERQQLLSGLKGPRAGVGAGEDAAASRSSSSGVAGVHELFESCASSAPDAIAVVRDDSAISYGEIERRANAMQAWLRAHGAGHGTRVAFCLDRHPLMIVTLLGILKAGSCYMPLDPSFPTERLRDMVKDARPDLLVSHTRYADRWRGLRDTRCLWADTGGEARWPAAGRPRLAVAPDDPAYIIYTSGSTGTPKGVMVPHRALLGSCASVVEATGIEAGDRFLHFAPIGFDVSAFQIFPALATGAAIVLAPPPEELSNDDILDLCRDGLTILDLASANWQRWIADLAARGIRPPASVHVFMTGGESTPMAAVRRWAEQVDGASTLVSSYGPTETAVTTTWTRRAADAARETLPAIPLGRAAGAAQLYVLDEGREMVPAGVPGELCVAGPGLSHGYVRRADETADRFRPDPLSTRPGARLYRTGDRVRYRSDGVLQFLGRVDRQLKLHGIRVETEEIERLLLRHPNVQAAVVMLTPSVPSAPDAAPLLAAYVVARDPAPGEQELRDHLLAHLPRAVLPHAFCFLPAFPATANGKVDRAALPPPAAASAGRAIVAARTETERLVIDAWAEVLSADGRARAAADPAAAFPAIGIGDDFFALGGHSMSAARLASRLQEMFDVALPVRTVFDAPTPARLALAIEERRRQRRDDRVPPLAPVERSGPVDLSFAQAGFWILQQFDANSAWFVNAESVRLQGDLSVTALAAALTTVVARHEALRTAFSVVNGRPVQIVQPPRPIPLPVIDLGALPAARREAAAARLARHEGRRAFALSRSPLLRAMAVRVTPGDWLLLLTMHHLVADAWSMGLLMEEVSACYGAGVERRAPVLPALPLQYADYTIWQRTRWNDAALDRVVAERLRRFGGNVPELDLPTDRPRPALPGLRGARRRLPVEDALAARVRRVGRAEGVTPFMSLLAALKVVFHLYTGQRCIVVAAPVANRAADATDRLIGLFINHALLVTRLDGEPTGREVLARVRASTLDAVDHQDLPFDELVRRLRPERQGSRTPLARVLFNLVPAPRAPLDLAGLGVLPAPFAARHRPRFDMEWTFTDTGDAITGSIGYDTELFNASTVDRMANDFTRVLRRLVDTPDRPIASLRLMTETQSTLALSFNEPV